MKKRFIFIPILIIVLMILYPSFVNFVASIDFTTIRENKRVMRIAREFDFERFINYVEENNVRDFDYSIFSDYIEKYNVQLKEEDVRYLFDYISSAVSEGRLTSGFNINVGVRESVSISVTHTYFGFMTLPVHPNYLRTMHKVFFYFIYFLIGLFVFLCVLALKKRVRSKNS